MNGRGRVWQVRSEMKKGVVIDRLAADWDPIMCQMGCDFHGYVGIQNLFLKTRY